MSLFTVTITGVTAPVEVYAGLPATLDYVGAMFGDAPDAFLALPTNSQSRVLAAVTRYIDRWSWEGAADAAGGTTLAFPRTGITDATGAVVADAAQLAIVARAVGELCALAAADSNVLSVADTSNNIRVAAAGGGVEVEYFNPTSVRLGTATPLPTVVQQLMGGWLASASSSSSGGMGESGKCESDFASDRSFSRWGAY